MEKERGERQEDRPVRTTSVTCGVFVHAWRVYLRVSISVSVCLSVFIWSIRYATHGNNKFRIFFLRHKKDPLTRSRHVCVNISATMRASHRAVKTAQCQTCRWCCNKVTRTRAHLQRKPKKRSFHEFWWLVKGIAKQAPL